MIYTEAGGAMFPAGNANKFPGTDFRSPSGAWQLIFNTQQNNHSLYGTIMKILKNVLFFVFILSTAGVAIAQVEEGLYEPAIFEMEGEDLITALASDQLKSDVNHCARFIKCADACDGKMYEEKCAIRCRERHDPRNLCGEI